MSSSAPWRGCARGPRAPARAARASLWRTASDSVSRRARSSIRAISSRRARSSSAWAASGRAAPSPAPAARSDRAATAARAHVEPSLPLPRIRPGLDLACRYSAILAVATGPRSASGSLSRRANGLRALVVGVPAQLGRISNISSSAVRNRSSVSAGQVRLRAAVGRLVIVRGSTRPRSSGVALEAAHRLVGELGLVAATGEEPERPRARARRRGLAPPLEQPSARRSCSA